MAGIVVGVTASGVLRIGRGDPRDLVRRDRGCWHSRM